MELIEIEVEPRLELGSGAAGRSRRAGKIPAVVYCEGNPAKALLLDAMTYRKNVSGHGASQLFKFKSANGELDGMMTLVKDIQVEALKGNALHVDFLAVHEGHKITITIPIDIVGEPASVKHGETIINQTLYEVDIECLPTAIPTSIVVDVSAMNEGDVVHVRDLPLPEGVEVASDEDISVLSVIPKRAEEEAPTGAAAAATAGTAATAAPAAAPAKETKEKGKDK